MMYRGAKSIDEEAELILVRDLTIQHKLVLEQQQAIFGLAHVPPHIPMGIRYYEQELENLNKRIAVVRRRKKRQERLHQIAAASAQVTQSLIGRPGPQRRRRQSRRQAVPFPIAMIVLSAMIVVGIVVFGSFGAARGQQTDGRTAPAPLIGDLETVATPAMLVALEPAQATAMAVSGVSPQTTEQRIIGNTGGIGVRFRVEPFQEAPSPQDLPDGALVYLLDNSTDTTGTIWWRVALASGEIGFVKERYLREP